MTRDLLQASKYPFWHNQSRALPIPFNLPVHFRPFTNDKEPKAKFSGIEFVPEATQLKSNVFNVYTYDFKLKFSTNALPVVLNETE